MDYFELINRCLTELNYQTCKSFSDLSKNDHLKIKNILNVINAEVCGFDNWNFLLRKVQIFLPKNTCEIVNTIPGRINSLIIDKTKYEYFNDFERFLLNTQPSQTFTAFNDKLLLPSFNQDKTVDVVFYTNQFAQNSDGDDIALMSAEYDTPIVPMPFVEPILVYGTCMRLKANPEYSKFSYWLSMYKDALATMRSKIGTNAFETPEIKLKRN